MKASDHARNDIVSPKRYVLPQFNVAETLLSFPTLTEKDQIDLVEKLEDECISMTRHFKI